MNLKDEFDKLDGGIQNKQDQPENTPDIECYSTVGNTRNLIFTQLNGDEEFFNYADLVNGKYSKEKNEIQLTFRTDTINNVTIKGRNLQKLFNGLAESVPRKIFCTEQRYAATKEEDEIVVTEIVISGQQ